MRVMHSTILARIIRLTAFFLKYYDHKRLLQCLRSFGGKFYENLEVKVPYNLILHSIHFSETTTLNCTYNTYIFIQIYFFIYCRKTALPTLKICIREHRAIECSWFGSNHLRPKNI
jgi:hypothetical protein